MSKSTYRKWQKLPARKIRWKLRNIMTVVQNMSNWSTAPKLSKVTNPFTNFIKSCQICHIRSTENAENSINFFYTRYSCDLVANFAGRLFGMQYKKYLLLEIQGVQRNDYFRFDLVSSEPVERMSGCLGALGLFFCNTLRLEKETWFLYFSLRNQNAHEVWHKVTWKSLP